MFGLKVSDIRVNLVAILIILGMASCSSPLEKSVLTPLTSKELDKVAGKDISFLATYSIVEEKSNYIHTPADSARWKDITYNRLHTYLQTIRSTELNSPLFTQLRDKWEKMYLSNNFKVDSLITFWNGYLKNNSPDSLLSLTFGGIETEKIRNRNKGIDTMVKVIINIRTLRTPVDSVLILYSLSRKEDSPIYYFPFNGLLNYIRHKKKVNGNVSLKVFPYLLPDIKQLLVNGDSSVVLKYDILSVYSGGKCYNADSLKNDLPKSLLHYLDAKSEANEDMVFDEQYYRKKIIRELINPSFLSQSAYIKVNAEDYYKEIDSLVFNYTNLNGDL